MNLGDEVLRVERLSRGREFQDVSFSLRAGEILGFTGLLGDGRSELFQSIFGVTPDFEGRMFVKERRFTRARPRRPSARGWAMCRATARKTAS